MAITKKAQHTEEIDTSWSVFGTERPSAREEKLIGRKGWSARNWRRRNQRKKKTLASKGERPALSTKEVS